MILPTCPSEPLLIHGDCLDVLPLLPGASLHFVLTDPPYGVTACKWDLVLPFEKIWPELWRAGSVNATVCMTATMPFGARLIMSQVDKFKYNLIYHKTKPAAHLTAKTRVMPMHEDILLFSKGSYAIGAKNKMPYFPLMVDGVPYRKFNANASSIYRSTPKDAIARLYQSSQRFPTSVKQFKKCRSRFHPSQKPLALYEWLIQLFSAPGDMMLDFCAGSGTAAIAAMRTGRRCICIEKDETYYNTMVKRVADERAKIHQEGLPI